MWLTHFVVMLVFVLLLPLCSTAQQWAQQDRDAFVAECLNGAQQSMDATTAKAFCECSLEKVTLLYPDVEMTSQLTHQEVNAIALDCMQQLEGRGMDLDVEWDEATNNAFLENCSKQLIGSPINAKEYCSCALKEVRTSYPNPLHALNLSPEELQRILQKCLH